DADFHVAFANVLLGLNEREAATGELVLALEADPSNQAALDALKGLLAVMLARYLGVGGWGLLPVMLAAVAGHIWPAQLGFRGGKGIATMVGALLAYNYVIPLLLAGMVLALLALLRSFTLAGMLAIGLLPLLALALGYPADTVVALVLLAALAIYAHRHNLLARLRPASGRA
ncbi:MAG TPA: glycerol-3-phosphate acyltransferase, partial [Kouleothrix sp.]|nr:glycerol-3-phosphate acyltransferase [Kouleothrix sp.]